MGIQIYSTKNNQWREYYNPLRALTFPRMTSLLEAGERGTYADLQWCYHYLERSDPMIFSVLQRRRAALLDCDWDIRQVTPGMGVVRHAGRQLRVSGPVDEVLAAEQVDCLRGVYDGIENFYDAVGFLFTGVSRGYAHLEKHYGPSGEIVRLEPVEQWFWVRDGMFAPWEYNQNAVSGKRRGIPIAADNFLILETTPLNRMLSLLYLRRTLAHRDWDAYLDLYGIPPVFLIGPPNAIGEKEKEYQIIADELMSNGRGYLPNGADIKFANAGNGGKPPYRDMLEYTDRLITLIGTGGLLTMLTEAGSGTLAGGAHNDSFQQIARSDASLIGGIFQRSIDLPILSANFPGQQILAYFEFAPAAMGEASAVAQDVAALAAAGFRVDPAQVSEKTGYREAPAAPVTSEQLAVSSEPEAAAVGGGALRNTGWTNEAREASIEVRRANATGTPPKKKKKAPKEDQFEVPPHRETEEEKTARLDALLPPDLGPAIRATKLRMITKGNEDWVEGVKMLYHAIVGQENAAKEGKK